MKTTRSIIARYYNKEDKTYAVVYTVDAQRRLISETLECPDSVRIGGYIKSKEIVTVVSDNGKIVSVMSDRENDIYAKLLADLDGKPADQAEPSLADMLCGKGVK